MLSSKVKTQIKDCYYNLFGERNNIELISMHIPKTAGTSFRKTLEAIYGKKLALIYQQKWPESNRGYTLVHGHFYLSRMVKEYPNARVITWVRNPILRIISLYFFWKQYEQAKSKLHQQLLNGMSLVDFASQPQSMNEIRSFFDGYDIEKFLFIGIVENYADDLDILAKKLSWKNYQPYLANSTKRKEKVDSEIYSELKVILKDEIDFYNQILEHRGLTQYRVD